MSNLTSLTSAALATAALAEIIEPVVSRNPKQYPFVGEKAVGAVLKANPHAAKVAFLCLYHLQTSHEQEVKETTDRNNRGFMGSDGNMGAEIAQKILAGKELSASDESFIMDGCCRSGGIPRGIFGYRKQMAVQLRTFALTREPELAHIARQFGV